MYWKTLTNMLLFIIGQKQTITVFRKCKSSFHFLFIHICWKGHKVCRAERCNNFNEKEL